MIGVEIRVDGTGVTVPEGASLLAAVKAAGIDLPSLCSDDRISRPGPAVPASWPPTDGPWRPV